MAAVKYGTRVTGFTQLIRALKRIDDGASDELKARLKAIGEKVALVAAADAPRRTGELQHSIKVSATRGRASVYSNVVYGGAINYGAWVGDRRGVHIKRANASHYMDKAVAETQPWVEVEVNEMLDWVEKTFLEG